MTYKAFDANLRCPVALKVVHRELLVHSVIRERFLREARLTARLRHPNVASILHLGARGGECFYAMEFIEGETLEELVRRHGPFAPARALDLCLQVARALGAAEKLQLVHRDIKPPNLMLTSSEGGYEHVKLIDFGVALWLDPLATGGNPRLTDAGLIGTPSFASPEQLQGDAVDARADFYSLGVTLWFLLAGHPPFAGGALQVIGQHLHREPPFGELETVNAPEPLVALLRSLLKKNPADRPQNARELRRSIERCSQALAGHATVGPRIPAPPLPLAASVRMDSTPTTLLPPVGATPAPTTARTVALLLTDIEGSTALWERTGPAFRDTLDCHHATLREAFAQHGGEEISEAGDGFFVVFTDAPAALACAVAAQRALANCSWPQPAGPLRVRMAIHVGLVERHGQHHRGLDLHRASRLLGAAHGGQILCSQAAAALVRRELPAGWALKDLGEYRLRDLPQPERLFSVTYPEMAPASSLAPAAAPTQAHILPAAMTRFFGRQAEITALLDSLSLDGADDSEPTQMRNGDRLVTLTGPGGIGKTRLSLAVAERVAAMGSHTVFFVSLADLADAAFLADRLRDALRPAASSPGEGSSLDQVLALLTARPTLLVLDNFEQLAELGAEFIGGLLARAAGLTCLITSRQRLDLNGEREFAVAPLPAPTRGQVTAADLADCESAQLFCDRARAVRADFVLNDRNAPAVAELCQRLEGVPLAIELAAARVQMLTPRETVTRLGHCLDFLAASKKDVAVRHRTLRATIAWSYELLSPPLRGFFARLAVFRGGWTAEAAAAVALGGSATADDALEPLSELRKFSLIAAEERGETMRYRMLETLRQFAEERLAQAGETEAASARARHRDFFQALALQAEPKLKKFDQAHWLNLLEAEHDNLRAVLAGSEDDGPTRLRLAYALHRFWMLHGYAAEGREWLARALAAAPAGDPLRAKVRNAAGALAWVVGDLDAARGEFEEGLTLFRALGDAPGTVNALNNLAIVASEQADFTTARAHYEESLATLSTQPESLLKNRNAQKALVLSNLGRVLLLQGAYAEGRLRLKESLAIAEDRFNLMNILTSLGEVEFREGQTAAAYRYFVDSIEIRQELGYKNNFSLFWTLATMANSAGETQEACWLLAAADASHAALGIGQDAGEEERFRHAVATISARMEPGEYEHAWAQGRAMSLESITGLCCKNRA